jgi:hypothetical protein
VIGYAAVRGDLQHAGLLAGRVSSRVTLRAPCRRVRRKDEAILSARDESIDGRTREGDVREAREERDPPVSDDEGKRVSAGERPERILWRWDDRTYCSVGAL